jgi:DNA-3-methyladenine glycosylase II
MKSIRIQKPSLFSFKECSWFLNRNYDDCLHHITPQGISKAILIDKQLVVCSLADAGQDIALQIEQPHPAEAIQAQAKGYLSEWWDLERDLRPFYALLHQYPALHYMATAFEGLRLVGIADLHEALCWSVIGQQINLTFAYKLKRALVERYSRSVLLNGTRYFIFPEPAVLAGLRVEELRQLQFSRQKAEYIIGLSRLFTEGQISKEKLLTSGSTEERLKLLMKIKGVGAWTANYVLLKTLKDLNCVPHGDAGLLNALIRHGYIQGRKDEVAIRKLFDGFPGWEGYLVFYLWRSLSAS